MLGIRERIRVLMYKKTKSRFSEKVRISKEQIDWLKAHKDCKTLAGFLDKIINHYKKSV